MIVLFEGVDGSGKSTLIDEVHRRTRYHIYRVNETPMDGSVTVEQSQAANRASLEMAMAVKANVLLDRSFVSEWVYSTALKREFNQWEVGYLDGMLSFGYKHVAVLLWFEKIEDVFKRETDDHITSFAEAHAIQEAYSTFLEHSTMTWLVLDANDSVEKNAELVVQKIGEMGG